MSPKAGKNDEARERSREALLQAGATLMVENAMRSPFASLRLRSICERAGYSTGAFYLHWDKLDGYYNALAEYLAGDEESFEADFAVLRDIADKSGTDALTDVTRAADCDIQLLLDSTLQDAMELLSVTWGRTRFQPLMARGARELDRKTGEIYALVLTKHGREPRPPFDWDHVGVVLQALVEGLGMRYKIDPTAVPMSSESETGLYSTVVAALLAVLTRPVGDDASINEATRALLARDIRIAELTSADVDRRS
jgi:AcrR family transcriptional regulator